MKRFLVAVVFILLIFFNGCENQVQEQCDQASINLRAYSYMKDWYLWYEYLPSTDVKKFSSLSEMLKEIKYHDGERVVDRFSYATKKVDHQNYYAGKRYGMGVSWKRDEDNALFVTMVYPESPADIAGLKRGQRIIKINDFTIEELDENAQYNKENGGTSGFKKKTDWSDVYNAENKHEAVKIDLLEEDEEIFTVVVLDDYSMKSILKTEIIDNSGVITGYLHLKAFISPSEEELNEAFQKFKEEKIEELVLDLRYNGGGLVRISEQLINLIAGKSVDGEKIIKIIYNDKRSDNNKHYSGKVLQDSMEIKRVAIITTKGTASASEMVINSLDPFIEVAVIGDTTYGKPVGMNSKHICDQTIVPITFKNANAVDYGDYYFGIEATCLSDDDFKRDFGDTREESLKEALYYLSNKKCSNKSNVLRGIQRRGKHPEELIPFKLEGMNRIDYSF